MDLSNLFSLDFATFQSNSTKSIGSGSNVTTQNIVSKVYFNSTTLTAYKGRNTVTVTVSAGGNGANYGAL
jgi:hypothetical protein